MSVPQPEPKARTPAVRLLSVNTHKGFAMFNRRFVLHELRDAVRRIGADIVFLQEVQGVHHRRSRRHANWPQSTHYEFLADQIWPQFAYGQNAAYPDGDHGNALLSKYPIIFERNHDVSMHGQESRGLLHCAIQVPGSELPMHAICVHLGLRENDRQQQLEALVRLIERDVPRDAVLVVAGDFNDWRVRAHRVLERCDGLREVFEHSRGRAARTFPSAWPLLRLDRIYVRNARILSPMTLPAKPWDRLSDHAPLAAEMAL